MLIPLFIPLLTLANHSDIPLFIGFEHVSPLPGSLPEAIDRHRANRPFMSPQPEKTEEKSSEINRNQMKTLKNHGKSWKNFVVRIVHRGTGC